MMNLLKDESTLERKSFENDKIAVYFDHSSLMSQYFAQTFQKIFINFSEDLLDKLNISRRFLNLP